MIIESRLLTPLTWLTAGILLLGVFLLMRAWRMTVRTNRECRDCGYDLTGIPKDADRCPECGGDLAVCVLTPEGSITTRRRLRSTGIRCIVTSLVAVAVLMIISPWRLTYTPTWVLANIDLPLIQWRGVSASQRYTVNERTWNALNGRLLRSTAEPPGLPPGFEIDPDATLTDPQMQSMLQPWFDEIARKGLDEVPMWIRPEMDLWEAGMRAGWWSPEEIGARIGPMPALDALSLDAISQPDGTEHVGLAVFIDTARLANNFVITDLELDIDRRTLKFAGLSDKPEEWGDEIFGSLHPYRKLEGMPGQSTIFTRHASESGGTLHARLVFVSNQGIPLASQWVSHPASPSILPTKVRVATGDTVEVIGRDLAEASVFIPDPEGGEGGRIVIATTNAEWAEPSRRDGQALDLVCPLSGSPRTVRKHERFVTEPSTGELPPLPDGRRRFTLREFEYDTAWARGRDEAHFGLDSMAWHDILTASGVTDPDWDPRTESRFIPFTVSIPSTAP